MAKEEMFNFVQLSYIRKSILIGSVFYCGFVYSLEWPKEGFKAEYISQEKAEQKRIEEKEKNEFQRIKKNLALTGETIFSAESLHIKKHSNFSKSEVFSDKIWGARITFLGSWNENIIDFYEFKILNKSFVQPNNFQIKNSTFQNYSLKIGSLYKVGRYKIGGSFDLLNEGLLAGDSTSTSEFQNQWFYGLSAYLSAEYDFSSYNFEAITSYFNRLVSKENVDLGVDKMNGYNIKLNLLKKLQNETNSIGLSTSYTLKNIEGSTNAFEVKEISLSFLIKWVL